MIFFSTEMSTRRECVADINARDFFQTTILEEQFTAISAEKSVVHRFLYQE